MPEAELPGNQHLPETNDPVNHQKLDHTYELDKIEEHLAPEKQTSPENDEDEWETVNFPDSISVDSIPVLETTSPEVKDLRLDNQDRTERKSQEVPEVKVVLTKDSTEELESANLMEALHECNRELINRVTELETSLEECQKTLENQEKLLEERTRELATTQQQVTRLFYKLELCNQIIQRQEVLVESLTDKWENSEQQQAQMERECALTKQSYNQQSYHLKELENSCRELRSRLYRQQQQTMQFKAALERCLEMPGRIDTVNQLTERPTELSPVIAPQVSSKSEPLKEETSQISSKSKPSNEENPFIQTNTKILPLINSEPVQPWSAQIKNKQKEESILDKKEIGIAKINLEKKLDLPQGLTTPQQVSSSEENTPENDFFPNVRESTLNPSLPSFSRIGEVPDYELVDEVSQNDILEDTEAGEYVVIENDLAEAQSQYQEVERLEENKVIAELKKVETFEEESNTEIKHERISWNISTGKWNVCEYQPELETEIDAEDFSEVSEEVQQDMEQATPASSKLHLPTWNTPIFESEPFEEDVVSEVPEKQDLSLGVIDLPSFPRIPIDDQPSAVNG
ncbi:MAG: hypothetical protein F6K22_30870 [Okeania sp. SIO2F4]|uniref:hypothetical protein n=1 Tax=Okeania sp. SIO2F4 TaxID=2607790 RepID=UPI00142B718E|nr:hypothetical protein [Okeania sp. SIO2F4]NES06833.1 hypothetical protein [Okeania sp. SIO2F4]